ncbi:YbjN domain-containing protein [Solwaraspora sp. WMMD792]|uniref:YbjN domain-containing protein n=1 Tax=Solwaraspora sp. WMMD792 TaxID=3016099 RepID=UPI002415D239|nr:YbjN domain-containing protein [Solwaraspora sp. WMMD792]MDG4769898.1 YbjN domain-containing protein [Solwaraspora sp. WMMD792]
MPPPDPDDLPDAPSGGGAMQVLRPLTTAMIAETLTSRGYHFQADSDGDLVGRWNDNLIVFSRLGPNGEVLRVRTIASTLFTVDDVPALYAFCNEWNHDRLWPKTFVHVDDDGTARVCGELITALERGVSAPQLDHLLDCGIATGCQVCDAVAELAG